MTIETIKTALETENKDDHNFNVYLEILAVLKQIEENTRK